MKTLIDDILPYITRPSRYLGTEVNSIHKDLERMAVKFLLAFPDVYEVGMSHLGFQILYYILNRQKYVGAERVFAPWVDLEKILREKKIPLFSLESRRPLNSFDIIGFSLQYELSYTNTLNMLDLSGIPLRSKYRNEKYPLIIAGGPCTFNPEPMAEFFDALVIGEGEEVILEIVAVFKEWRKGKGSRDELLNLLSAIPGVYVPSKFAIKYQPNGSIKEIVPLKPGYNKIKKRVVANLNNVEYPTKFIVPFTPIVHDHINLEVARGCTRGCRFCQAGMIYRPVRERSHALVEKIAEKSFESTGWEEMSLLSLSAGDYSGIEKLLGKLITKFSPHHITITFPSLRAETIQLNWLNSIKGGRKTGFTIAPEAGTERMRRIINKTLTESEIVETCFRVFSNGWRSIKLYFMIGLPTETKEDLEGIIQLAQKISTHDNGLGKKPEVTVSVSTFIPKPHTPFQWLAMISEEEIKFRQTYLLNRLKRSRFIFKWQDPLTSVLEGVMARGDRRMAEVIEEAFRNGSRFDGWTELFNFHIWEHAFQKTGLDIGFYFGPKDESEIFPWDHIDSGINKDFLWEELINAKKEVEISDCRLEQCHDCGVCDFKSLYPRIQPQKSERICIAVSLPKEEPSDKINKIRLTFRKTHKARLLSHLEMMKVFGRAARRAKLPLRYTQGFHPHPRIIFGPALPVGMESFEEYVDIELLDNISIDVLQDCLNKELPSGFTILSGKEIPLKTSAISDSLSEISYSIQCNGQEAFKQYSRKEMEKVIEEFLRQPHFPISIPRKGEAKSFNLRPMVKDLIFSGKKTLELTLRFPQAKSIRPTEAIGAIWSISEEILKSLPITKTSMKLRETWVPN